MDIPIKLIRFGAYGNEKPGIWYERQRLDCSAWFNDWNASFFRNEGIGSLMEVFKEKGHLFKPVPDTERWGAPVARPGMILCVGLNYSDHAKEAGMAIPEEPILFMKAANTLCGPFDQIPLPKASTKMDWEVELGIVMGSDLLYADGREQAQNAIGGYCMINDISERSFQLERGGQWVKGKSSPFFTPAGPWLSPKEAIPNVSNLHMELEVNGSIKQKGNTSNMIFDPIEIVRYASQFMQLEAGDIISTGTPPGVGMGLTPAPYLNKGDTMKLTIQGLGCQEQKVI